MIFFYKNYPYSPLATLISAVANVFAVLFAVGGIAMIASGLRLANYGWSEKNIRTKPRYALQYCRQHPEAYAELAKLNPAFGEKYMVGENGKIVKRS